MGLSSYAYQDYRGFYQGREFQEVATTDTTVDFKTLPDTSALFTDRKPDRYADEYKSSSTGSTAGARTRK